MKNNILITILIVVIVAGAAFFAGTKYQQRKMPRAFRQFGGQVAGQMQGNRAAFRPVNGEIISADDKSITVKMTDGSSKIVLISDKTEINQASQATKEDLKVGEKVMVIGAEGSDGTVTAQNIQLNPQFRGTP